MAQVPQISRDPIEVLTNRDLIAEPFPFRFWSPALLGGMTFFGVCISNWYMKRPMLSGIQQHIIFSSLATLFGTYYQKYRDDYLAERDAIFRHYISLHPEDFPPFERKKFSEVFKSWTPIR